MSEFKWTAEQVADQYKVVAALAANLKEVHEQLEPTIRQGMLGSIRDIQGERSAHIMEVLGDILNEMDAVAGEDAWMNPIFEKAHACARQGDEQ